MATNFVWNWALLIIAAGIVLTFVTQSNKKGAPGKRMMWTYIWIGVAVFGFLTYVNVLPIAALTAPFGTMQNSANTIVGNSGQNVNTGNGNTIVTSNPIYQVTGQDKQAGGTTVGILTTQSSVNGGAFGTVTLGTTAAVPGQVVDLFLINASNYHNGYCGKDIAGDTNIQACAGSTTIAAGTFPITYQFNKNATVTENIFNTLGVAISNGGGATNQTDNGNGASYTWKDSMSGTSLQSTQDMTCVFELTAGVNASTTPAGVGLSVNGAAIPVKSTSIPAWYSPAGVNSRVWLFDIAPLSSAAQVDYSINLNALSTGRFSALSRMIKTCYTKEYFVDPNTGMITYDVADSNNAIKSLAKYGYTAYFQ